MKCKENHPVSGPASREIYMPLIVDKDKVRTDILMAFERCIDSTPMGNVSLRDIAQEAGMSHANLLNYFDSKDDLMVSYVRYVRDYVSGLCYDWFSTHSRKRYKSNLTYMNAFMAYVANGKVGESRPSATMQAYVLAHYNDEIAKVVRDGFEKWFQTVEECLIEIYGEEVGRKEAEVVVILIAGTRLCNYTGSLSGKANNNILGLIDHLISD